MSKVKFEFDAKKDLYDIALCTHRVELGIMLQDVQDYIRNLDKYEDRTEIPAEEVSRKLYNIIDKWYVISKY